MPAIISILSVSSSPIVILPPIVTLPVTSKLPVILTLSFKLIMLLALSKLISSLILSIVLPLMRKLPVSIVSPVIVVTLQVIPCGGAPSIRRFLLQQASSRSSATGTPSERSANPHTALAKPTLTIGGSELPKAYQRWCSRSLKSTLTYSPHSTFVSWETALRR